jgi:hypothetical protein
VPLLLVEITTLLLLRLSPMVRLTRATFFFFALMLGVWAAWALAGFGYPSAPLPIALNIASKILAFVTAFTLFLPQQLRDDQVEAVGDEPQTDDQAGHDDRLVHVGVDPGPAADQERLALGGPDHGVDLHG